MAAGATLAHVQAARVVTVVDVLNGAADLIERDGWCQGWYHVAGRHCIAGAIDATLGHEELGMFLVSEDSPEGEAREAVAAVVGENWTIWNDAPGRTQAEVVAALRAASGKGSMTADRPDGFVVRFELEVVFDTNASRTGYDHVGTVFRCVNCGVMLESNSSNVHRHARTHEPA